MEFIQLIQFSNYKIVIFIIQIHKIFQRETKKANILIQIVRFSKLVKIQRLK